jgi:hypothetical protein
LNKQKYLLAEQEKRIILAGLNSIDELNELETREQKEYKEKTKRET